MNLSYDSLFDIWRNSVAREDWSSNRTPTVSIDGDSLAIKFDALLRQFNPDNYPELRREVALRNALVVGLYSLIVSVSLFGNLLVCYVILANRCMRSRTTNAIIANLTISDLIMTVFTIPLTIVRLTSDNWIMGRTLCKLVPFIQVASVYTSTLSMAIIALDRYQAFVKPFSTRFCTKLPKSALIALIWLTAAGLSVPYAIFNTTVEMFSYKSIVRCQKVYPEPQRVYRRAVTTATFLTQYLIPLLLTILVYALIGVKLRRRVSIGELTEQQASLRAQCTRKTIKMLALVVLTFAVCWLPLNLYHLLADYDLISFDLRSFYAVHWLAMSSVCYNPFIYFWLNKTYRRGLRSIVLCRAFDRRQPIAVADESRRDESFWAKSSSKISRRWRRISERKGLMVETMAANQKDDNGEQCQHRKEKLSRIPTLTTTVNVEL